ncbi:hypothetical protein ABZ464_26150 [Streptomyces sp. NPDC005820]|uniref:hypothetical protein n=1 Tax=Streptomyces sp. NPDC005820 TaxID=3157069 RepID=UPI0033E4941D
MTEHGREGVQRDLTAFFRTQAWSYLVELPEGAQTTAEDPEPRFLVEATKTVLAAAGLGADQALRVWVLVHEQPDGTWGAGGSVIRHADLAALAKG